jgi:hypothetical protein
MNDPFRYAFMVEMENLLAKVKVFQRSWSAGTYPQRILIVANRNSLLRSQNGDAIARYLMSLAPLPANYYLMIQSGGLTLITWRFAHHSIPLFQ